MGNYKTEDVQEKVKTYLGNDSFKVSSQFSKVLNLRDEIEVAIKKACLKNNLKYQNQFSQVIETVEGAMLSSKNWFNEDGLNFTSVRDFLNIKVEIADEFLTNFELRKNVSGDKNEKYYDVKELIAIGQAKRFKGSYLEISKLNYNPCLRFREICIKDNSDAYQENLIKLETSAKGAIVKKFDKDYMENTLLMGIHYHSYSEEGEGNEYEYCPLMEKFELVLLI